MILSRRPILCFLLLLCVSASLRLDSVAQVRPVNDYGAIGLSQMLRRMSTTASVMMIGAHPDDEDSALLAYLARGENARTAYLSLTRGDGGQNIIGPELFESLGIIRTEELLQARRLDGAEQYFARAFDYGFSKTLDEAKSKWREEVIKCDAVRAIRLFRPLVVISRFSGTPADGHGQHQYSGYISPLAVAAAGDTDQCEGAGDPWRVSKFYVGQGFSSTEKAALQLNTGRFDSLYGRSYFEIAMEGRSQHKSQGEGRVEFKGDQFSGLRLQGSPATAETSPFEGLDTTIVGIAKLSNNTEEPFASKLLALSTAIDSVKAKFRPDASNEVVADLAKIYKMAYDAEWSTRQPKSKQFLEELQNEIATAIRIAAGIQVDLLSDKETVTPGGEINATLRVFSPMESIKFQRKSIVVPKGYSATEIIAQPTETSSGPFRRESGKLNEIYRINVARDALITQPYWLKQERKGEMFAWPAGDEQTLPFSPQGIKATLTAFIGEIEIPISQQLEFRSADASRGELRREVNVIPPVSVSLDKDLVVASRGSGSIKRKLSARITNNTSQPVTADLAPVIVGSKLAILNLSSTKAVLKPGETATVELSLTIPGESQNAPFRVGVEAKVDGVSNRSKMHTVAYPHIQTHRYYTDAVAKVVLLDLAAEKRNIGYVMGSGDEVPEAIRQIGMPVTMLEATDLASGELSKFDTIVVGVRATETRPDMMANKARLLEYVSNGGNLVVQYQRGQFANSGLPPFPVTTAATERTASGSIARVTDETAKVTILKADHPFFNSPNMISDRDFEGWVQERNAYNLVTFDPQYVPLLESHDAGEQPNNGGLVTVKYGKGNWTYCSYSFFRQLPDGVPGAYRLFANMLSLPRGDKN